MKQVALAAAVTLTLIILAGCGTTAAGPSTSSGSSNPSSPATVDISISPAAVSLQTGATQQFTATVTGSTNTGVSWNTNGGNITATGLYTAPSTPGTYIVGATSAADPTKVATSTVTVTAPAGGISVSVSPASASLPTGGSQQFTATVTGTTNTAVTWKASGGTINSSGLYVAPAVAGVYTVTATSVADSTKAGASSVAVSGTTSNISISISPTAPKMLTNGTQQFAATVTGTTNTAVAWTASGGSISSGGLFTAPAAAGSYTITATALADASKHASATATVVTPVAHSVQLSWGASSSTVSGYNVYRSNVSGSSYTLLNTQPVTPITYTDSTVQSGKTYYYVITAVDGSGNQSTFSNQGTAVIPIP